MSLTRLAPPRMSGTSPPKGLGEAAAVETEAAAVEAVAAAVGEAA